jgi:hypothetical protein
MRVPVLNCYESSAHLDFFIYREIQFVQTPTQARAAPVAILYAMKMGNFNFPCGRARTREGQMIGLKKSYQQFHTY